MRIALSGVPDLTMVYAKILWLLVLLCLNARSTCASVLPRQEQVAATQAYLVFGDSYSDDCNAWRMRTAADITEQYPFPACPDPTLLGSARSTGGFIWPEMLRNGSDVQVLNFAVSGATCSNSLYPRNITIADGTVTPLPAVDMQIETFQQYNSTLSEGVDYTALIFIGTNDLGMYFSGFQYDMPVESTGSNVTIDQEATCVVQQVQRLFDVGVKRVVVLNTTPLQYTALFSQDQVSEGGTQIAQNGALTSLLMKQLVFANNALQQQLLAQLNDTTGRSGTGQISVYDAYQFFNELLQDPPESAYGSNPSITGFSGDCCEVVQSDGCTTCPDPQSYFYFDALHPSETTSQLLAQDVARYLNLTYTNPLA